VSRKSGDGEDAPLARRPRKRAVVKVEEQAELTQEQRFMLETLRIRERGRHIALFLRCAAVVACFYITGEAAEALAGKTTIAKIFVELLSNQNFSNIVAWLVGATGAGIGLNERRLRRRDGKQMGARLRKFEEQLDPGRHSSKLDHLGDYQEED
jgi:hypothetical protein